MPKVDEAVGRKAKQQYGLISREQALELGLSSSAIDRRVRSKQWQRFCTHVYRLAGTPSSDHQRILGACLACGPAAVASHSTAAFLWGLDGFGRALPLPIEVSVPRATGRAMKGVIVHHPRDLAIAGKSRRMEIPVTHLARTLFDLAQGDAAALERALDSAWRMKQGLPRWLESYGAGLALQGRVGAGLLLTLVKRRRERPTDSSHEVDVLKEIRRARLPLPTLQHDIFDDRGFIARVDFAWVKQRVVLFADGWGFHHSRQSFDRDHEQRERLAASGWTPVEVTPRLVANGSWLHALARHLGRAA